MQKKDKGDHFDYMLKAFLILGWPGGMLISALLLGVDEQLATYYLMFSGLCLIYLIAAAIAFENNPDASLGEPLIYTIIILGLLFAAMRGCAPQSTDDYDPSDYHLRP